MTESSYPPVGRFPLKVKAAEPQGLSGRALLDFRLGNWIRGEFQTRSQWGWHDGGGGQGSSGASSLHNSLVSKSTAESGASCPVGVQMSPAHAPGHSTHQFA